MKSLQVAIVISLIACIIGLASIFITHKSDNPIEQVAERVIEKELNLPDGSIDLTPEKEEPKS